MPWDRNSDSEGERRSYLINDASFVEVEVGLDAVRELEIAGIAACFRRGALCCTQTVESVSSRVGYAHPIGDAVR